MSEDAENPTDEPQEGSAMDRETVIKRLSDLLASPKTPAAYVSAIAGKLAQLQGWETRGDAQAPHRSMAELFDAWRIETRGHCRGCTCPVKDIAGEPPEAEPCPPANPAFRLPHPEKSAPRGGEM